MLKSCLVGRALYGPAATVHNRVRGMQPWPLAATMLAGVRHVIRKSVPIREWTIRDGLGSDPGTVLRAAGDDLIVACGNGTALQILELQPEGRRTMSAREFLAGRGTLEGARFGT